MDAGMVVCAYDPRTWKRETGESRVHYPPHLLCGLKISRSSMIPYLKQNINKRFADNPWFQMRVLEMMTEPMHDLGEKG